MADALLGGIVINEVLVDPNGANNFDTDGNGTAAAVDEYIELFNDSTSAIDISGLQLWDAGVGHWFTFPVGTVLQPGAHAMVMSGVQAGGSLPTGDPGDLFFDAGRASPLINNGGDNITVLDPVNNEFIQATFNGDTLDDPTLGGGGYAGFPPGATRNGLGEDFGNDTDGFSLQRAGDGANIFASDAPTPGTTNVCFVDGTLIETPKGVRRVETIVAGDHVSTLDRGAQQVLWAHHKVWTPAQIAAAPQLAPVRISAGALGSGLPQRDLCVSQHHRVLVRGVIAMRMFAVPEVLVPAKALLGVPGVRLDQPARPIRYVHVMCARHEVLLSEGLASESLFLGREARRSICPEALAEVWALLGLSANAVEDFDDIMTPARPLVAMRDARKLVARHVKNAKPLARESRAARSIARDDVAQKRGLTRRTFKDVGHPGPRIRSAKAVGFRHELDLCQIGR